MYNTYDSCVCCKYLEGFRGLEGGGEVEEFVSAITVVLCAFLCGFRVHEM